MNLGAWSNVGMEEGSDGRLREVSETVSRLQLQVDGLYAETKHFAGRAAQLGEHLDVLESRSRSWLTSLLSRNLPEQLEQARAEAYEAQERFDDARRRFEQAKADLDAARGRKDDLAITALEQQAALDDKEERLLAAGDPLADRLNQIAAERDRQTAVLQETADLVTSLGWSSRALDTLDHLLGGARDAALTDLAGGGMLASKAKYDEIDAVNRAAAYAEQCLARLADELRVYGERQPLHTGLEVDPTTRFLDIWLDSGHRDVQDFLQLMKTQQRLPRTRSLLQQIGDDLDLRRAEIVEAVDELTAERQRLLEG